MDVDGTVGISLNLVWSVKHVVYQISQQYAIWGWVNTKITKTVELLAQLNQCYRTGKMMMYTWGFPAGVFTDQLVIGGEPPRVEG